MTSLPATPPVTAVSIRIESLDTLRALVALTKPTLAFMSVLTTMVAYATARPAGGGAAALLAFVGTGLAASGALSLNQWWERDADARMQRTCGRPLPRARVTPRLALGWSVLLSSAGVGVLGGGINLLSAAIAAVIIVLYGLVYTPLKRRTRWATEIGAISGALPALLGNAAAGDLWAAPGTTLAAVLLCWQMPHFFAIGWRHRADYRAAGFRLLPAVDDTGRRTSAWTLLYTGLLMPVSLGPWVFGPLSYLYSVPVALAGAGFLRHAWQFAMATGDREVAARRLFLASIRYLPIVLGALALECACRS